MTTSHQSGLFDPDPTDAGAVRRELVDLPDADIVVIRHLFGAVDSDRLYEALRATTAWHQATVKMYGADVPIPRLQAWHGEPGATYSYSGIDLEPLPWTAALLEVKARVEAVVGTSFNSVLANLYRDGGDSVGWHADDEPELGSQPIIGSVSFGVTRPFQLRHQQRPELRHTIELTHGSLVVMRGPTQACWKHQIPKTNRPIGPRINLTFRSIIHS